MNNNIGCGGCVIALTLWAGSVSFVSWILMLLLERFTTLVLSMCRACHFGRPLGSGCFSQ